MENLGVGLEGDEGTGLFFGLHLGDDMELLLGDTPLEGHRVDFPIAGDLDLEPLGNCIDAFRADAVGTAGVFVVSLAVFAAGMEAGEHEFHAGNAFLLVDVHGDAAAVVTDGDGAVAVNGDVDVRAVAGEEFVHRVIEHFRNTVMKRAFIGATDVHSRLFPHRFESF